jgi:hypothetical protein
MQLGRQGKHLCYIASASGTIVKDLTENSCSRIEVLYRHLYGCEEKNEVLNPLKTEFLLNNI